MSRRKSNRKASWKKSIIGLILLSIVVLSFWENGYSGEHNKSVGIVKETQNYLSGLIKNEDSIEYNGVMHKLIAVDGGDISGDRESNVVVDIGYGDREYFAFTNEYGQLIHVTADSIVLQDDENENVTSAGRYYSEEAKVPGTEHKDLDQGHIIADSLGGVANAYNITPQNSQLNRHGDQAYMEKNIRDAGGCEDFVATITYPNTETQIPSNYHYEYTLNELQECNIQALCNMYMLLNGIPTKTYREECTYWMCVMEVNRREANVFPESQEVVCLGDIYDRDKLVFKKHEKYMLYAIDEIMLLCNRELIPYIFNMVDGDDMCVWTRFGLGNKPDVISEKEYAM